MKSYLVKAALMCIAIICSMHTTSAQQSKNILLGKTYTKSASASNTSILKFTSSTSGLSENVTTVLGKKYESTISFTYKIVAKKVTIEYENSPDKEDYMIDVASSKLISTHLQGYVDGKWGKVYWSELK